MNKPHVEKRKKTPLCNDTQHLVLILSEAPLSAIGILNNTDVLVQAMSVIASLGSGPRALGLHVRILSRSIDSSSRSTWRPRLHSCAGVGRLWQSRALVSTWKNKDHSVALANLARQEGEWSREIWLDDLKCCQYLYLRGLRT